MSSEELLTRYLESGSDADFDGLVRTYGGLVLGTAIRKTGDRALAEDISQQVFVTLYQKARTIREPHRLGAWLHRTTLWHCANAVRHEASRRAVLARYQRELEQQTTMNENEIWESLRSELDQAIDSLRPVERDLLIWRFFEKRRYSAIGRLLMKSEDACRKQTGRVLRKLHRRLRRQGVAIPMAVLATGLASQLANQITPACAAALSKSVLTAESTIKGSSPLAYTTPFIMTKAATPVLALIAFLLPIGIRLAENRLPPQKAEENRTNARALTKPPEELTLRFEKEPAGRINFKRGSQEIARIIDQLSKHPNPTRVRAELSQFFLSLSHEELPLALDVLPELQVQSDRSVIASALFSRWVGFAPQEAAEIAVTIDDPGYLGGAIWGVMKAWVRKDRRATWAWIEAQPNVQERERLVKSYWTALSYTDPVAAAEAALAVENNDVQLQRFEDLLRVWRKSDPEAALQWVKGLEDGARRDQWFKELVTELSYSDPKEALAHADSLFNGYPKQQVYTKILAQWGRTNPHLAFTRMIELPEDVRSLEMVEQFGSAMSDISSATEFAAMLSVEGERNHFIHGIVKSASEGQYSRHQDAFPALARLVAGMTNFDQRQVAARQLADGWLSSDQRAARSWIESTKLLSATQRERLLEAHDQ